jgi:hypothetical protein
VLAAYSLHIWCRISSGINLTRSYSRMSARKKKNLPGLQQISDSIKGAPVIDKA